MVQLQSSSLPIELSTDNSNWLTIVCLTDYQIPVDTAINEVDTFCGKAVGRAPATFNPSGNAIAEMEPTSNQVTYAQMLNWQLNDTLLYFRVQYPGSGGSIGSDIYLRGQCTVTNTTLTLTVGSAVAFSWTLTGQGLLDNNPA